MYRRFRRAFGAQRQSGAEGDPRAGRFRACLTGKDDDFQALLSPVIDFLKESPSRVPMTDWYDTGNGAQVGFQARSVVGGLFIRLLYDSETVASWRRGR
ncbi:DUF1793 domain-containing protein [uncultured Victivallis sp.]|uniref:glutaminase domain-containing protein n=1 Tax=uncultured Victivallis sp. TaxID=354118 RepID=UPI0025E968F1|nr:DUF1793 domain-containing protein [uncultured Victivallis sp.]